MSDTRLGRWVAGALAISGPAIPLFVAAASPAVTSRGMALWSSFGLLLLLVAFLVWEWADRTGARRRLASWEPVIQQMRGTGLHLNQMQRDMADLVAKTSEIGPLRQILNEERHNLSLVASGMVEIREIINAEQVNLGALATGVHEVRVASEQRDRDIACFSAQVGNFNEIVSALRVHLDALSSGLTRIEERILTEQGNLGLVASGLDAVRRSIGGVERFEARQDTFEDALVMIADRFDTLPAPAPKVTT